MNTNVVSIDGDPITPYKLPIQGDIQRIVLEDGGPEGLLISFEGNVTYKDAIWILEQAKTRVMAAYGMATIKK